MRSTFDRKKSCILALSRWETSLSHVYKGRETRLVFGCGRGNSQTNTKVVLPAKVVYGAHLVLTERPNMRQMFVFIYRSGRWPNLAPGMAFNGAQRRDVSVETLAYASHFMHGLEPNVDDVRESYV